MTHLNRKEIFYHRLPYAAVKNLLSYSEYRRLAAVVPELVQPLFSDICKIGMQIVVTKECPPLFKRYILDLYRTPFSEAVERSCGCGSIFGAGIDLYHGNLTLHRQIAHLRCLYNRLIYPTLGDFGFDMPFYRLLGGSGRNFRT